MRGILFLLLVISYYNSNNGYFRVFLFSGPQPCVWPPALVLAPGPGPKCVFTGPGPSLYLPALVPSLYLPALALNLYLPALAPNLCLPALSPNLYLPALSYNFITSPWPEFCIYRPCPLNLYLYLRPLPMICVTGRGLNLHFPYYW